MSKYKFALVAAFGVTSCSEQPKLSIELPADAAPAIKQVVEHAWPKVLAICPGLNRYAADLSFVGIEDNLSYAPDHAKRIDVVLRVSDNPSQIPTSYRALGHACYFGISPDEKKLVISKQPCASVCVDSEVSESESYEKVL